VLGEYLDWQVRIVSFQFGLVRTKWKPGLAFGTIGCRNRTGIYWFEEERRTAAPTLVLYFLPRAWVVYRACCTWYQGSYQGINHSRILSIVQGYQLGFVQGKPLLSAPRLPPRTSAEPKVIRVQDTDWQHCLLLLLIATKDRWAAASKFKEF